MGTAVMTAETVEALAVPQNPYAGNELQLPKVRSHSSSLASNTQQSSTTVSNPAVGHNNSIHNLLSFLHSSSSNSHKHSQSLSHSKSLSLTPSLKPSIKAHHESDSIFNKLPQTILPKSSFPPYSRHTAHNSYNFPLPNENMTRNLSEGGFDSWDYSGRDRIWTLSDASGHPTVRSASAESSRLSTKSSATSCATNYFNARISSAGFTKDSKPSMSLAANPENPEQITRRVVSEDITSINSNKEDTNGIAQYDFERLMRQDKLAND